MGYAHGMLMDSHINAKFVGPLFVSRFGLGNRCKCHGSPSN